MARGVNKVILIGNLGQDPEVRFTPSGTAVANLNLATTDTWMDRQSGQRQERTEWHRVVMFNKLAEIAQQYLKKGSKLYVEGRLQTRKWQDQNGQDKYSTEIVANDMQMLDGRGDGGQGGGFGGPQGGGYGGGQQGGGRPPGRPVRRPAPAAGRRFRRPAAAPAGRPVRWRPAPASGPAAGPAPAGWPAGRQLWRPGPGQLRRFRRRDPVLIGR